MTVADTVAARAAGATWTATASVTPLKAPAEGRYLRGFVQVVSVTGQTRAVIGQAEVQLKNVAP